MRGLALAAAALALATGARAAPAERLLARVVVDGMINPAVADFVHDAIARARADDAAALVIELDTPGGLMPSMKAIVKDLLDAPLPVIVWVAPRGASAGSAGVFITLAAHVAAMTPGTSIGAAHPVGGQGEDIKGTLGEKLENATASFIEGIARQRGRNAEWAVKAVQQSVSITAEEAVRTNVVDFVAKDLDEVVRRADGRKVEVGGETRTLALGAAVRDPGGPLRVATYQMTLAQRLLDVLADPNIAYILMAAGMLGLYIEFTHPGVVFPGVAGAICFLLALTVLHVLPVTGSGLALLALGIALLVAEAFLPTFGLLGVGGLVAFLLGSLFLFDTARTGVAVARSVVFGVGGTFGAAMLLIAFLVFRSQRRRVLLGAEGMIGTVGVARQPLRPAGTVLVHGEYWTAESDEAVNAGEKVEVTGVEGLRLRVRPLRGGPRGGG
ncbi:MAG TPA: nodulation protein NfeD [Candidatus Binatia bacterium]|nr:nodulation protein NfeD [Candidatus Binatia bacterium]